MTRSLEKQLSEAQKNVRKIQAQLHKAKQENQTHLTKLQKRNIIRQKRKAELYTPHHGYDIPRLESLGFKVVVEHVRYIHVDGDNYRCNQNRKALPTQFLVPTPNHLIKGRNVYPFGGSTHVSIYSVEGVLLVSCLSNCSFEELFDKKRGITVALNTLTTQDISELMSFCHSAIN